MINSKGKEILLIGVLAVVGMHFTMVGLVAAMGFLAPISIAVILTMMLIPLSRKLESWGMGRGLSSLIGVLITMVLFVGLFAVISVQVNNVMKDWPRIEKNLEPTIDAFHQFIEEYTGLSAQEQKSTIENTVSGESGGSDIADSVEENSFGNDDRVDTGKNTSDGTELSGYMGYLSTAVMGFMGFIVISLLVFIYIFFMLFYRRKLKLALLKFFQGENRVNAEKVLNDAVGLSQSYLVGRLVLMFFLTILYSVGLYISGVDNAILIGVIGALLSVIPFVGALFGYILAMAMAAFTGGDLFTFLGVTITYGVAQFIETYILQPYLLGGKVNLNPLIVIMVVVLGGAVWGVMGMIISIPVFGILKIIFDQIPALRPIGYMLGDEDISAENKEDGLFYRWGKKFKSWFSRN